MVTPEVPAVEKLLQRLVTDTQSRPVPTELEQPMRPSLAEQRRCRREGGGGGGGVSRVRDHVRPGTQEGEQCRLFPHN